MTSSWTERHDELRKKLKTIEVRRGYFDEHP